MYHDNAAYLLFLIRNGEVKNWNDLCDHFGCDPTSIGTLVGQLKEHLRKLKKANLITISENNQSYRITDQLDSIQKALKISIKDLSKTNPYRRLIVEPIFGYPVTFSDHYTHDIFVLMPFLENLKPIYEDHLKQVAQTLELSISRADDFFSTSQVVNEIWSAIYNAKVIIADCTGRNPNVFYEIGLAHTLGKSVILITQNAEDVPFDLRSIRYIKYEYTPRGMKELEDKILNTLNVTFAENS